jgi:exodeoxyribonuclease V alpha subunit
MNTTRSDPVEAADAALAAVFARHAQRWAIAGGAAEADALAACEAARQLSLATANGQVCVLLDELATAPGLPADAAAWRAALLASTIVGRADSPGSLPLTLDDEGRLYLQRFFDHERRLAARLRQAAAGTPQPLEAAARAQLDTLFGPPDPVAPIDWQKAAAALALRQRLLVISGGPGTGKTTAVVKLLACLLERQPDARIALAAPTGKAAARMTQAIRQRALLLPAALRERLPAESFTVHRLLGVAPQNGGFLHDAGRPLPLDVLIVDEASMLDLALASRLLDAMPASARIVLLGDKDQLAAVESGAVFSELSAEPACSAAGADLVASVCGRRPPVNQTATLPDSVVWLQRNFRFAADSGIGRLATEISAGRGAAAVELLRAGADDTLRWLDADEGSALGGATLASIAEGYAPYLDTVRRDPADADAVAESFERYRVLCALRAGPRGVDAVNEAVTRLARPGPVAAPGPLAAPGPAWYPGRPVMVLRNDYLLKLFNGDIGLTLPAPDGTLAVHFPDPAGGWRRIAPARLPPHQTAYAMTVHKSQGSEFEAVMVLLPAHRSRVLTRELLYTAVTRARGRVAISAPADVLAAAIDTATHRHSGLLARLRASRPLDGGA